MMFDILSRPLSLAILITLMAVNTLSIRAEPLGNYYMQHAEGWHWYRDPDFEKPTHPTPLISDPVAEINAEKKALARALDNAVLHPTPQNIQQYITLQNAVSNRASLFSQMWQSVLLEHPELNYSLSHPTNQLGRQVYLDEHSAKEDAAIHALADRSGLFFFYRSSCPYCVKFAPILKAFSERYGLSVIPITTDGVALPEFPNSQVDKGQARRFNITVEPALFTVNPYTHRAIPVAYGLTSETELRERILQIATASRINT